MLFRLIVRSQDEWLDRVEIELHIPQPKDKPDMRKQL